MPNRFTVVLDANVLFGALQRNILLSLAEAGFFRPRWSPVILAEVRNALAKRYNAEMAEAAIAGMDAAFPEAMVVDEFVLASGFGLPDPKDAHVLGTAIAVRAAQIVTENLKDFPDAVLDRFEIEAVNADMFLSNSIGLDRPRAAGVMRDMRQRFKRQQMTGEELISLMEKRGLVETASELADYVDLI